MICNQQERIAAIEKSEQGIKSMIDGTLERPVCVPALERGNESKRNNFVIFPIRPE